MSVDGAFSARLEGANGRVSDGLYDGEVIMQNVTGLLRIETWSRYTVANQRFPSPDARPQTEEIPLDRALLTWRLEREALSLRFVDAASARVEGAAAQVGRPVWLERDTERDVEVPVALWPSPSSVEVGWKRGWGFVGEYDVPVRISGFPSPRPATLTIEGAQVLQLSGGNLTIEADGSTRTVQLGARPTGPNPAGVGPGEQDTRVILTAQDASTKLDLPAEWAVGAPVLSWSLAGDIQWSHATGDVVVDGVHHRLDDAPLSLLGNLTLTLAPLPDGSFDRTRYSGEADASHVLLAGAIMAGDPAAGPAAGWVALGAIAALAAFFRPVISLVARCTVPLYTRLTDVDVVNHPRRAAILAVLQGTRGVHLRELHRQVGGAWGPFAFHLRVLERFSRVRVERSGGYSLVRLVEESVAVPVIASPTQRRVLDAIPQDGPIAVKKLEKTAGLSRQLTSYHLKALEAKGLIVRTPATRLEPATIARSSLPEKERTANQ